MRHWPATIPTVHGVATWADSSSTGVSLSMAIGCAIGLWSTLDLGLGERSGGADAYVFKRAGELAAKRTSQLET
jgi:hypothetical protein